MEKTSIKWAEAAWNPWSDCSKVLAGGKFCYMYRINEGKGIEPKIIQNNPYEFARHEIFKINNYVNFANNEQRTFQP